MIKVYTTIKDLYLGENVEVIDYKNLNDSFVSWIDKTMNDNLNKVTPAERHFAEIAKYQEKEFIQQPFFSIGGRHYFLDFYLPDIKVAVEINGSVHKKQMDYDFNRDKDFESIGIKTIRIVNREVFSEDFQKTFNYYVSNTVGGYRDVSKYYFRPFANVFDGKLTPNQKAIYKICKTMLSMEDNSSLLIRTPMIYLLYALRIENLQEDTFSNVQNKDFIYYFFRIKEGKKIDVGIKFTGQRKNLKQRDKRLIFDYDNHADKMKADKELIIDKATMIPLKRLKYNNVMSEMFEYLGGNNTEGKVFFKDKGAFVVMNDNIVVCIGHNTYKQPCIDFYKVDNKEDIDALKAGVTNLNQDSYHVCLWFQKAEDVDRVIKSLNQIKENLKMVQ